MLKLNRSIADTSRQSYMRKEACGIRHHQNCGIGPSLSERLDGLNRKEGNCCDLKDICKYQCIYPQLVEFELVRTIVAYRCAWRNKLFE